MSRSDNEAEIGGRLDALLSARMDDDLTSEERVELEALIASNPDHAARALAFENVDVQLRTLAAESIDEDGLASAFVGLRARLAIGESDETGRDGSSGRNMLGNPTIPLVLAVAAAIILYLVVPTAPPSPLDDPGDLAADSSGEFGDTSEDLASASSNAESELSLEVEDELILVLGYGDEMSELQGITRDDLDVIEQLELLDFLSDREQALGELGEMGERG